MKTPLCLTALAALALVGCSRDLPRVEVARELDQLYPHAPGVHLTLEVQAEHQGELLLAWKSKRRLQEATYQFEKKAELEYRRAGLIGPGSDREEEMLFNPRSEQRFNLLEVVDAAGTEFEIDGFIAARKVLGRWEVAGLEVRRERPGKTMPQFQRLIHGDATQQALFGRREQLILVVGSKEWSEHLSLMQKLRARRIDMIRRADEELFNAVRPGQYFEFGYDRVEGSPVVQVWTFAGSQPGEGVIHFHTPRAPELTRTFRFERRAVRGTPFYTEYPKEVPALVAKPVALGPNGGFGISFFAAPDAFIRLQVLNGHLQMQSSDQLFELRPLPSPGTTPPASRK